MTLWGYRMDKNHPAPWLRARVQLCRLNRFWLDRFGHEPKLCGAYSILHELMEGSAK